MLVLGRDVDEVICIGEGIEITVVALRAFIATVTIENIVVVDDSDPKHQEKAKKLALKAFQDESVSADDFELEKFSHVPTTYELDSEVYHDGKETITVQDAAKLKGGYACDNPQLEQLKKVAGNQ